MGKGEEEGQRPLQREEEEEQRQRQQLSKQRQKQLLSSRERPAKDYIPSYLRHVVFPYHGDFCQSPLFHPRLVAQLMAEGFLPIATRGALLPKLHLERCVISLPQDLHTSKSVKKQSKRYDMTINQAFNSVVQGCNVQHAHCWLYPPLVQAFQFIVDTKRAGVEAILETTTSNHHKNNKNKRQHNHHQSLPPTCIVRMYSIEVWNRETGELVAGELGYTVGSIYTSLTGFSNQDGAGSVQMAALGRLLCQMGFTMWDLGMEMEYKHRLGAHLMPRSKYVKFVHNTRQQNHFILSLGGGEQQQQEGGARMNARDIINRGDQPLVAITTMTPPAPTNSVRGPFVKPTAPPSPPKKAKKQLVASTTTTNGMAPTTAKSVGSQSAKPTAPLKKTKMLKPGPFGRKFTAK